MHLLQRAWQRLVKTLKEIALARETHLLERAEARTGQTSEIKLAGSTHSLEWLRSALVRSQKERKPERGTHFLNEAEVKAGQNIERKGASVGHLQT